MKKYALTLEILYIHNDKLLCICLLYKMKFKFLPKFCLHCDPQETRPHSLFNFKSSSEMNVLLNSVLSSVCQLFLCNIYLQYSSEVCTSLFLSHQSNLFLRNQLTHQCFLFSLHQEGFPTAPAVGWLTQSLVSNKMNWNKKRWVKVPLLSQTSWLSRVGQPELGNVWVWVFCKVSSWGSPQSNAPQHTHTHTYVPFLSHPHTFTHPVTSSVLLSACLWKSTVTCCCRL